MITEFNKETLDQIKSQITSEQMFQFLKEHGGEPVKRIGCLVARTICHNKIEDDASHKLYYYENTQLFKCYTGCSNTQSFDIFELVIKIGKLQQGIEYTLYNAVIYVVNYFSLDFAFDFSEKKEKLSDFQILNKYEENLQSHNQQKTVELKIFDEKILKNLPFKIILPWIREGITEEVMLHRGIKFNPMSSGIVIPHYDINNNLIGIRERTLIKENEEKYGKYMPSIINGKMYNHPLGFNLYNINNSKDNIKELKMAIIGEGEKFCLGYASYFGEENDISVACCGSNLINYQVDLLLSLGVQEIVIAFDKQFKEPNDDEFKRWVKKLTQLYYKYSSKVHISFMFDKWDLLGYKESPIDAGKDVFVKLLQNRFSLG